MIKPVIPGYEALARVLTLAYRQAAVGKGRARHSTLEGKFYAFDKQPIVVIGQWVGAGYELGQVIKKCQEARILPKGAAQAEILGAINYLAAAYLLLEASSGFETKKTFVVGKGRIEKIKHGRGGKKNHARTSSTTRS